jgi:DNA-directed RNA polymerase specialized sigma24 family protein
VLRQTHQFPACHRTCLSYDRMGMTSCKQPADGATCEQLERVWMEFQGAMRCLEPEARAAFLLHEVFEASYEDIAMLIGLPEDTCRRLVERALAQAGAHMADRDEHPEQ